MAGAAKKRVTKEKQSSNGSSEERSSSGKTAENGQRISPQRSSPTNPPRYDGNRDSGPADPRDPQRAAVVSDARNLEGLGFAGWALARGVNVGSDTVKRPAKLNKQGREITVGLNTFSVKNFPSKPIHQYDVTIGSGTEKRGLIQKAWASEQVQSELGKGWIFDGNKIAWSMVEKTREVRINVDLDVANGRASRGKDTLRVVIRPANVVKFDVLNQFLAGKCAFDNSVLESINFLDHLMRMTPSSKCTQIKKSFFARGQQRSPLGNGIEAFKGVFASIRIAHGGQDQVARLAVNVDVSNGTFWTEGPLMRTAIDLCRTNENTFAGMFAQSKQNWDRSPMYLNLKRLRRVWVVQKHQGLVGKDGKPKSEEHNIEKVMPKGPKDHKFELVKKDDSGNVVGRTWITVYDHFAQKYKMQLNPSLPIVKMSKKETYVPMEVLYIKQNQRYQYKLDDKQTSNMIKFAVTLPAERWGAVQHGLNMLDWPSDPYLRNYGVSIDPAQTKVKARVLPAPDVVFANGKNPAAQVQQGRWRIDGKKFITPNTRELVSWGVCAVQGRGGVDSASCDKFFDRFAQLYTGHGGKIKRESMKPAVMPGSTAKGGEMITEIWNKTGNKFNARPQILFFVVPDRNSELYARIKKSCECRYGVVSQVLQAQHVSKCQDQYISNVCMKVNAKLGGATCRAEGTILKKLAPQSKSIPTMCIGADVSHGAPGAAEPASYAALTVSMDQECLRYAAQVDTNGVRVEMITTQNITNLLDKMVKPWMNTIGRGNLPQRVLYFRDGVSEGQFPHVLDQEVKDIKTYMKNVNPKMTPQFVVVICSKRHHIRFFPEGNAGDRNGNPVPGTLVETHCTHPFDFDFYLNAHSAIKGTARPIHYNVLLNEANMGAEELQQFIYEHSYQYMRSTTPVSLFPAVYYAHLASNRAKTHDSGKKISSGKKETEAGKSETTSSDKTPTEVPPLMAMNNQQGIDTVMWYI